jgi:hypothetical protein
LPDARGRRYSGSMRLRATVATASSILCLSAAAQAAPGSWAVGIERAFGFSRVSVKNEVNNVGVTVTSSQVSLFAHTLGGSIGYPAPRVALDYLFPSGLSVGGAIGYQSVDPNTDTDDNTASAWVFAPRAGYFASVSEGFGVWPRGGFTFMSINPGVGDDSSQSALTLEVPLVLNVAGNVCFSGMPYLDVGIGGGTDDIDRTVTEFGLQFGMSAFF